MGRHVSELTIEELAKAGAEAARDAIAEARAAGLAVTGYARDAEGQLWLARLLPTGEYEWIERVGNRSESSKSLHSRLTTKKLAG